LVLGWLSLTVPKPEDHLLERFVRIWELEVTHKKYQKEMKWNQKLIINVKNKKISTTADAQEFWKSPGDCSVSSLT